MQNLQKIVRGRIILCMTNCSHTQPTCHESDLPPPGDKGTGHDLKRFFQALGVEPTRGAELMHKIRLTAQLYDGLMGAKIREGQVSAPRMHLLICLYAHELQGEESLIPTRLSMELGLSKNTISAHLRALEEMGMVERRVDPDDLRQFQICIAEEGRACIRACVPQHMEYMDKLVAVLEPDEVVQLLQLLNKLIAALARGKQANGA